MYEHVTERLVDFALKVQFRDLPQEAVDKIKLMLLDSIGCALGAYVTDRAKLALAFAEESGGNPQASIIGGHRTSYDHAAFVNGELITALDYDILGPIGGGHVAPFVTSPCLAMAEKAHVSGEEFLTALLLAHEMGGRFLSSLAGHRGPKDEPPYYEERLQFSHGYSFFGGVIGACKLLGLDAGKTRHAFGIAGASAPVPAGQKWEFIDGPAIMTKFNAWCGWASELATVATLLAEKGFTGDTTILDGERGFWRIVGSPTFNMDTLFGKLGEVWLEKLAFKRYPVCGHNRRGIEGIKSIMQEHEIMPEEIEEIVVKADRFMLTPNRLMTQVKSFADMQYSNVNIFAVAAYYGDRPSPAWQTPIVYNDPRVKALVQKIKVEVHPQSDEVVAEALKAGKAIEVPDIVEIKAKGRTFVHQTTEARKGTSANPMTKAELVDKFMINASYSPIASDQSQEIVQTIDELEKLSDICQLTRLLSIG
ncbi:MAG: hypothetical protein A2Y73_02035 [Chloroflexi bacterium RBG_13_56_8]|nr:MAG: hypothetical protein A2Y73_02035 [Chloroflexi bacterium RBG_13_56_8]